MTAELLNRLVRYRYKFTGAPCTRLECGCCARELPYIVIGYTLGTEAGTTYTMGLN